MILTCPNCSTRFLISAQVLAPEGRRVKCSKCSEDWFQMPDPDELINDLEEQIEDIPESVKPIPEGSAVPAVREEDEEGNDNSGGVAVAAASATAVFVVILAALIFMKGPISKSWPASAAFYQMLGMKVVTQGQGLEFDRMKALITGPNAIQVEGFIINLKSETQNIPLIEAVVKNSDADVLAKWYIQPPSSSVEAEGSLPFRAEYHGALDGVESLHLRFVLQKSGNVKMSAKKEKPHNKADH